MIDALQYYNSQISKGVRNILDKEEQMRGMCQCRKCNHVFHSSEIKRVHNNIAGLNMIDLICPNPECGSKNFGLMDFTYNNYKLSNEGIYKKNKFYKGN
jgi:hypothetical protein